MGQAREQVLPLKIDTEALHAMLEGVGSFREKVKIPEKQDNNKINYIGSNQHQRNGECFVFLSEDSQKQP